MQAGDFDLQYTLVNGNIPAGQSLSGVIDIAGMIPYGMSIAIAGTAATLTFEGSFDNVTFLPIETVAGATQVQLGLAGTAGTYINGSTNNYSIPCFCPRFIKVRSGTTVAPVVQAAQLNFTLIIGVPPYHKP
jgi:hypothetical protein